MILFLLLHLLQPLVSALDEMEKVNSQLSLAVEEVTDAHRQKAEVILLLINIQRLIYIIINY